MTSYLRGIALEGPLIPDRWYEFQAGSSAFPDSNGRDESNEVGSATRIAGMVAWIVMDMGVFQVNTQMVRVDPLQSGLRLYMLTESRARETSAPGQYLVMGLFLQEDAAPLQFGQAYTGEQLADIANRDDSRTDRAMWAISEPMPIDTERWKLWGDDRWGDRLPPMPWEEMQIRLFRSDGFVYECMNPAIGAAAGVVMFRGGTPRHEREHPPICAPCSHHDGQQWDYPYPDVKGYHRSLGAAASGEVPGRRARNWLRERLGSG